MAVLEELEALCRDKSLHEFLQQEVVDGYHDHEEFVRVAEAELLDTLDEEIRDSMGMVTEGQYRELFGRYLALVSSWTKGERIRNRITGAYEQPDEERMTEFETIIMGDEADRTSFRRSIIASVGAHRLDHPDAEEIDDAGHLPRPVPPAAGALLRGAQAAAQAEQGQRAALPLRRAQAAGREGAPPRGADAGHPPREVRLL